MGLEDTSKIDILGSDETEVVMFIVDAFQWNPYGLDGYLDDTDHMELLMEKINGCLHFWESGQLWEQFPGEEHKQVVIRVVAMYELDERGDWFYQEVGNKLAEHRIALEFELSDDENSVEARRAYEEEVKARTAP